MCKEDNGNNMLNLNEEIKQRVDEIRVKSNTSVNAHYRCFVDLIQWML
jgi:hypothetical protein